MDCEEFLVVYEKRASARGCGPKKLRTPGDGEIAQRGPNRKTKPLLEKNQDNTSKKQQE